MRPQAAGPLKEGSTERQKAEGRKHKAEEAFAWRAPQLEPARRGADRGDLNWSLSASPCCRRLQGPLEEGSTERQKAQGTRHRGKDAFAWRAQTGSTWLAAAMRGGGLRLEPVGVAMRPQAEVARSTGLEPVTPSFEGWCSIQLSYERKLGIRN